MRMLQDGTIQSQQNGRGAVEVRVFRDRNGIVRRRIVLPELSRKVGFEVGCWVNPDWWNVLSLITESGMEGAVEEALLSTEPGNSVHWGGNSPDAQPVKDEQGNDLYDMEVFETQDVINTFRRLANAEPVKEKAPAQTQVHEF
jgi:hypothetical protein